MRLYACGGLCELVRGLVSVSVWVGSCGGLCGDSCLLVSWPGCARAGCRVIGRETNNNC